MEGFFGDVLSLGHYRFFRFLGITAREVLSFLARASLERRRRFLA